MNDSSSEAGPTPTVLFVCLHGSAKSLIAAEHFNRLARSQGVVLRGESAGVEPDPSVPPPVVAGLAADGIDVRGYTPRRVTLEQLAAATWVVSFGCELPTQPGKPTERWDDLPLVSDGFAIARDAIVARLERLIEQAR